MKNKRAYPKKVFDFFEKDKKVYFNYLSANDKVEIFSNHIPKKINQKYAGKKLRILCIGGGSGKADLNIIKKLKVKDLVINYIDPSKSMKNFFVKEAAKLGLENRLRRVDLSKFEEDAYKPPKADLILCVSSVYFLEGWRVVSKKNPLLKIYNNLVTGGTAVVVLKNDKSDHCAVKRAGGGGKTCGRDVRMILRKLKIPHYWEKISTHIDVSACFQGKAFKPNKQGIQLLSFMFKGQWDKLPEKTRGKIIKILKSKVMMINNKPVLKADHDCIWIVKPSLNSFSQFSQDQLADQTTEKLAVKLKEKVRSFDDFPKKGVVFKDTTPILKEPKLFREIINYAADKYRDRKIDLIAAKDMQGLIWAGAIALELGVGIIPMFRKDLPGDLVATIYAHEYNPRRVLNLQKKAIKRGQRVLLVDYMMATGETVRNMIRLIEHVGGKIVGVFSLIELTYLGSREGLKNYDVHTVVKY